jgi:hypothetical protein
MHRGANGDVGTSAAVFNAADGGRFRTPATYLSLARRIVSAIPPFQEGDFLKYIKNLPLLIFGEEVTES